MAKGAAYLISGRVQGVSFRAYAEAQATKLGLVGTVRNLATGQVEAKAWGDEVALERFKTWLTQGSPGSQVIGVQESTWSPTTLPDGFYITY